MVAFVLQNCHWYVNRYIKKENCNLYLCFPPIYVSAQPGISYSLATTHNPHSDTTHRSTSDIITTSSCGLGKFKNLCCSSQTLALLSWLYKDVVGWWKLRHLSAQINDVPNFDSISIIPTKVSTQNSLTIF